MQGAGSGSQQQVVKWVAMPSHSCLCADSWHRGMDLALLYGICRFYTHILDKMTYGKEEML